MVRKETLEKLVRECNDRGATPLVESAGTLGTLYINGHRVSETISGRLYIDAKLITGNEDIGTELKYKR